MHQSSRSLSRTMTHPGHAARETTSPLVRKGLSARSKGSKSVSNFYLKQPRTAPAVFHRTLWLKSYDQVVGCSPANLVCPPSRSGLIVKAPGRIASSVRQRLGLLSLQTPVAMQLTT